MRVPDGFAVNEVTLRGFDAPAETATNSGTSALPAGEATQNPTHAPEPDALAAFVASLTPEQRAKLAALFLGDSTIMERPPNDA